MFGVDHAVGVTVSSRVGDSVGGGQLHWPTHLGRLQAVCPSTFPCHAATHRISP